jgi:ATP-dependent helicase/nuclease subunit A
LNETAIVTPQTELWRPDRVMFLNDEAIIVDYKTSNKPDPIHRSQVIRYMSLLTSMGKKNVKGFVWYLGQNLLIDVNDPGFK